MNNLYKIVGMVGLFFTIVINICLALSIINVPKSIIVISSLIDLCIIRLIFEIFKNINE